MARTKVVGWGLPTLNCARLRSVIGIIILLTGIGAGFGALPASTYGVNLAWDRSPSVGITGYRIYFGPTSKSYTNSVAVGNVTSNLVTGLVAGTYFFTVVAYDANGIESLSSNEIMVVPGLATLRIGISANRRAVLTLLGPAGHTYEILAAQTLGAWAVIGTVTIGTNGSVGFTDTNAPIFPKRFYRTRDTQP